MQECIKCGKFVKSRLKKTHIQKLVKRLKTIQQRASKLAMKVVHDKDSVYVMSNFARNNNTLTYLMTCLEIFSLLAISLYQFLSLKNMLKKGRSVL